MRNKKSAIAAFYLAFSLVFSVGAWAAEEEVSVEPADQETSAVREAIEQVKIDTEIQAEDLGVKEAKVLPGSFFYGFKSFFRGVQEAVTRDPMKKAELQLRHTNEKMIEAKQLVEKDGSEKAAEIAAGIISGINKSFEKIANQGEKLKNTKSKDGQRVEKFLDKIVDQSLKQQVVLQNIQDRVPEKVFAKIEQSRQEHLEKFGQVMTKVSENQEELAQRLPQIIENRQGSDFKELKVVEILRDLEDKVPEEAKKALREAQSTLSQRFEQRFATISPEVRKEKLQNYVESLPGNAVRQFEAFDRMRESFQSEGMAKEMELAKDQALRKFEDQFSQFQGEDARQAFMRPWSEGSPEALRTMTEMEMRLGPAEGEEAPQAFQNFQEFRREAQDNFKERFSGNPEELKQNSVFQKMESRPDVIDLKMSQDLVKIFSPSEKQPIQGMAPEGTSSALNFMRDFQNQATEKFIENFSNQPFGKEVRSGSPVPGGLKVLEEIKNQVPFQGQQGINRAIEAQAKTIERHLEQMDDPRMLERYQQQIEGDKVIKEKIQQFAPPTFFRKIEEKRQQMEKTEQFPLNQPIFKPADGGTPAGQTSVPQGPNVPLTPERVELFEDRQIEKIAPQVNPAPTLRQDFQQNLQPAPLPQPTSPDILPKF